MPQGDLHSPLTQAGKQHAPAWSEIYMRRTPERVAGSSEAQRRT
jgi:hypothetical protein